jgi:hypothetical protein
MLSYNNKYLLNHLCGPDSLNGLGYTNVVRLKLVQSNTNNNCCQFQTPVESLSDLWHTPLWNVISHKSVKTDVRVDEDGTAENGIGGRVERASDEGCDG